MPPSKPDNPANPYDELPYYAYPIEWTTPERLALASLLHGGPRAPLDGYRLLELGCANGANLLPMAWYRRHGEFVGVDASARQISIARDSCDRLGLQNMEFIHSDFGSAAGQLAGPFDFIIAHGVFSWVTDRVRDEMLELSAALLAPGGLLYLNYNTHPGWTVRGLVRDFLLRQTAGIHGLEARAERCRQIAANMIAPLKEREHAYTRLMAHEFKLVTGYHPAYIAHEYLSPENKAYWRSEFFAILQRFGFSYIADADFNCLSNRITADLAAMLGDEIYAGEAAEDSADLLCYRQMQSPVLTFDTWRERACSDTEFGELFLAANLVADDSGTDGKRGFRHPSGQQVETDDQAMANALLELQASWPLGRPLRSLFEDVGGVRQDLEYLHRHELVELRCIEPGEFGVSPKPLNELEQSLRQISTSPWHTTSP